MLPAGRSRQLTNGVHYEHSIDWSPDGREIAYISNREQNEDQFFNYDLFTLDPTTGECASYRHRKRRIPSALFARRKDPSSTKPRNGV